MPMGLSRQDEIWNRAALELGGPNPREGDAALAALLLAHGMVMNGGLDHAVDVMNKEQYASAIQGFRFFGLSQAASVLERAVTVTELDIATLNTDYGQIVPDDSTLVHAFRLKLLSCPEAFSPIAEVRHV